MLLKITRSNLGIFAILFAVFVGGFYTPASTLAAWYVWDEWHAGRLALALDRNDASLALAIGSYYFGNQAAIGKAEERPYELPFALRAFGKAITIHPSLPLAHYMRARIEFIQSDFDRAIEDLNAEFVLQPENKRVLYMRGLTYAYRGLPGDLLLAEQDFSAFAAWAPREWAGYNDLAFVLGKEKKYKEAMIILKEGIEKADGGKENPWLWSALGVMELNLDNPAAALASFTKAQSFSETLTETDWQRAYPGNKSILAEKGIENMKMGIAKNIVTAYAELNK